MAYFTIVDQTRDLTEEETVLREDYVAAQVAAGNTTGVVYGWSTPVPQVVQRTRMWKTLESANGFVAVFQAFTPPVAVVVY